MSFATSPAGSAAAVQGGRHRHALVVVTLLFFMWGLLTSLNDVLIPHLKSVYSLSYVQAMLVQFCFFGAYFLVSLPAGAVVRRLGYQRAAVAGLVVAAGGCALFYPAAASGYALFLMALFVLAAGITLLQVAANPYVTALGAPQTASSRLTLTQAFNALGTTVAPVLGGLLILPGKVLSADELGRLPEAQQLAYRAQEAALVQGPYLALAAALLALALLFAWVRLPRIADHAADAAPAGLGQALRHRHLLLGVVCIFVYVGAEVSIGSFLINFMGEARIAGLSHAAAAPYVGYYWGGAMAGRFIGAAVMRHISPGRVLGFNAAASVLLILTATQAQGALAMWALLAVGLCNSIMFPTIFSMALHRLGPATGAGSGLLCMAIAGGAIVPFGQGLLADLAGVQTSFLVPAACYLFIVYFGLKYAHLHRTEDA
ncbi:sugar MFS transporter [Roseateles sp. DC23W]|uniref:Sugar MFS transporter n=1 Tax=Pelomonas dachongensis TaxID=3299029 RepID=A0ABW7ENH9_9BURK